MDNSFRNSNGLPKKQRQHSVSIPTSKQPYEKARRNSQTLEQRNQNKLNSHVSPERGSVRPSSQNSARKPQQIPSGKENYSNHANHKRKKSRQQNLSYGEDPSRITSGNPSFRNNPEIATRIQNFIQNEQKLSSKRDSVTRPNSGAKNHRRVNSFSVNQQQQRIASQHERKSSLASAKGPNNNNSMLNQSYMMDDNLNYSREYSYIRDSQNDMSNIYASGGGPHHSRIYQSFDNDQGMLENHHEINFQQSGKKSKSQNFFLDKGKSLFKQKDYKNASKFLKEAWEFDPKNVESCYLLGVSFLWMGFNDDAIEKFVHLLEKESFSHRNVFILLSIAQKKIQDFEGAIRTLTKAVAKYPKYYDAFIFRGKLYLKEKKWERALTDFKSAILIDENKSLGYIGQGDCLRMLGEYDQAITCYSEAMSKEIGILNVALLKRAIAYIEQRNFDEAIDDLERLIINDPAHSEAFYFKGLVLEKKKDHNEALLCFEQAIKHNGSKKAVLKSLYEVIKIKIENRDFYEAFHTLHRAELLQLDMKIFTKFKYMTEGVIYLMKRKHEEGIDSLTQVIKRNASNFIKSMAYNYRAYGYLATGKTKKALQDYQELSQIVKLEKSSTYNRYLCEGILAADSENFEVAEQYFDKTFKIYKKKMEPHFYKACLKIQAFRKQNGMIEYDQQKLSQAIIESCKELNLALQVTENVSNLFYVRGVLLYALEDFEQALLNIEKAIEKAEDNYAKYYYLRGCIHACLGNFQNALSDLTIATNLDKSFGLAYLERGKCYFALGEIKQTFLDIQKYINLNPDDPNIHLWAGNLLFNTRAFEDAVRAYSNSQYANKSEKILKLKAKCNIVLKELNAALSDLSKLIDLKTSNNINYVIDYECLSSLKIASTPDDDSVEQGTNLVSSIIMLSKMLSYKSNGGIFQLPDLYFYKAIYHVYLQEYEPALMDMDTAWNYQQKILKQKRDSKKRARESENEMIKVLDDFCSDKGSQDNQEPEYYGAFDDKEYMYNRAIILIMLKNFKEAVVLLEDIRTHCGEDSQERIDALIQLCFNEADRLEGKEVSSENQMDVFKPGEEIQIFDSYNRLSSIFPCIALPFKAEVPYEIRLSFCLPQMEPPSLYPTTNTEIINEISVSSVESKPEAPWIRRNTVGVIFTENLLDREEKEIDNLNEIIRENNLKQEDIYKVLEKTKKDEKKQQQPEMQQQQYENLEPQQENLHNPTERSEVSNRDDLNQAVIFEDENLLSRQQQFFKDLEAENSEPLFAKKPRRIASGGI